MSVRDRWETLWKMNRDPSHVFQGVKDLEFVLKRTCRAGPRVEYDFVYAPEDPNNDPFKNTTFVQAGKTIATTNSKLNKWQESEKDAYQTLIDNIFGNASKNVLRLEGEKEVGNDVVPITLFLLQEACGQQPGNNAPPHVDLIVPVTRDLVHVAVIFDDGTGHGNPK
jgi:hypothetical protein